MEEGSGSGPSGAAGPHAPMTVEVEGIKSHIPDQVFAAADELIGHRPPPAAFHMIPEHGPPGEHPDNTEERRKRSQAAMEATRWDIMYKHQLNLTRSTIDTAAEQMQSVSTRHQLLRQDRCTFVESGQSPDPSHAVAGYGGHKGFVSQEQALSRLSGNTQIGIAASSMMPAPVTEKRALARVAAELRVG